MKGSAFVPGHITGFFEIFDHEDSIKAGSRGAGVVLDKGVYHLQIAGAKHVFLANMVDFGSVYRCRSTADNGKTE